MISQILRAREAKTFAVLFGLFFFGINLGVATIGNFGSTTRYDYTIIGDAVNAVSRIEGRNKDFGTRIIISETTRAQLTSDVPIRDLGEVTVRGKEKPIRVFEVTGGSS